MKIAIVGISNIHNIGEDLLIENAKFLAKQSFGNVDFKVIEIAPRRDDVGGGINYFVGKCARSLSKKLPNKVRHSLMKWAIQKQYTMYYRDALKDVDAIVYAFGMLKYSTQSANYLFYALNSVADDLNIPVFMNAMSIQAFNPKDLRAINLAEASKKSCVRMITTRDNLAELAELDSHYRRDGVITMAVGDPALWSPEALQIPRKANSKSVRLIGINVISLNQFQRYGASISESEFLEFYGKIIQKIVKKGYDYRLFCNGLDADYQTGQKIINTYNLSKEKLIDITLNTREYVRLISAFDCVLGARLHTSITCCAFNIPVVSIVWDNKIRAFYKKIGKMERLIEPEDLNTVDIVNLLESSVKNPYEDKKIEAIRNSTLESFKKFAEIVQTKFQTKF